MKTALGHQSKLTEQLKQERIIKASPQLLEALEAVVAHKNAIHMDETVYLNCLLAIKAAKGE